jgi:peptide subunit release factor 1 (eRF1)
MAVASRLEQQVASSTTDEMNLILVKGEEDIVVPALRAAGLLKRTVHVVAFTDEEGVRFQSTFLGSRAVVRSLSVHLDLVLGEDASMSFSQAQSP